MHDINISSLSARTSRRSPRRTASRRSESISAEQRAIDELQSLIDRLPSFGPLARYLKAQGIDPKSKAARRLSAYALAYLCLGLKKIPRPEPTKWNGGHDIDLRLEVSRLRCVEGISERAAI